MKKLLLALLFVPCVAAAEYMPRGCYVAYSNPGYCWSSQDGVVQWLSGNRDNQLYLYGSAVEAIVNNGQVAKTERDEYKNELVLCIDDYNALDAKSNSCSSQYSTLVDQYNGLVTPYNKNLALIKKLRRACGSKCKKIK